MREAASTWTTGSRRREGAWLAVALLIHGLVLLLPLRDDESGSVFEPLQVRLMPRDKVADVTRIEPNPPAVESPDEPGDLAESAGILPEPPPLRVEDRPEANSPPRLTTALLIESLSRAEWLTPTESASRQLGVFKAPPMPANWLPLIRMEQNRFDGMMVPVKTQIIDRWLAADGSHNVVIETSSGHTLCGRAEAWNPMQPLIEPVMMFRSCGGGGERTFKVAPVNRERRNLFGDAGTPIRR